MPQPVLVFAEHARVAAHGGLDRQRVLQQAVALRVFGQQRPGCLARQLHMFRQMRDDHRVGEVDEERARPSARPERLAARTVAARRCASMFAMALAVVPSMNPTKPADVTAAS